MSRAHECVCVCTPPQAKELDIPEDNVLAQKVRERQGEEERERQEMRGLVLQKARLISDSADDDESFNRNNKGGLNMKARAKEEVKVAGPPVRQVGKKVCRPARVWFVCLFVGTVVTLCCLSPQF